MSTVNVLNNNLDNLSSIPYVVTIFFCFAELAQSCLCSGNCISITVPVIVLAIWCWQHQVFTVLAGFTTPATVSAFWCQQQHCPYISGNDIGINSVSNGMGINITTLAIRLVKVLVLRSYQDHCSISM